MVKKLYQTRTSKDGRLEVQAIDGTWKDVKTFAEALEDWPSHAQKSMGENDGVPALISTVYQNRECGCEIVGNGTLQFPLTIQPCKKHG
jgi:hypothetical protein